MNRTAEEYLSLLLWDLRQLTDGSELQRKILQFHDQIEKYVKTERLVSLLSEGNAGFTEIAKRASCLAGSELDEHADEACGPLRSVFSRLRVSSEDVPTPVYIPAVPLSLNEIFPSKQVDGDYSALLHSLSLELHRLDDKSPQDFYDWIVTLDTIFKKYLWCVPAKAGSEIDVSLYDRMKVTAAIGTCLLETGLDAEKPYLLLAADFSGIQNYIFSVARMGSKGVSKRLRARSFLVDTMVQGLAFDVCKQMEVPQGNIMMLTGGKFYLLLPNLPDTESRLCAMRDRVEAYLYHTFHGEISVNMAWVAFGDEGLLDYSMTITELSRRLRESKQRPFRSALIDEKGWNEDGFILFHDLAGKRVCESCRRRLISSASETKICPECEAQESLGGKLATCDQLWMSRDSGEYKLWDRCYLSFNRGNAKGDLIRAEQLNNWELREEYLDAPLGVRLMANQLPKDERNEPLTFEDLAEQAGGTKRIAVLKADVDNLGYLFADGMREKDRHYGTISRVSALSRSLDLFFSGYVGYLLKTKYKTVYSVFSGGDDLFLIGPWDVMPEIALEIHHAFTAFSGSNPCVTLSAAVVAASPKVNIALLAEGSEQVLKGVKNTAPQEIYPGKQGRNGVSFLGTTFSWDDLEVQLNQVRSLEAMSGAVDVSILRRLGQYSRMYRSFLKDHDVMGLMFEPLFHYDQARNYEKLHKEKAAPFLDWAKKMKKEAAQAANYKNVSRDLYFAETVITCYLNKTKKVRNNGI